MKLQTDAYNIFMFLVVTALFEILIYLFYLLVYLHTYLQMYFVFGKCRHIRLV